ncbi:MAG: LysR family transcriptional regulator [Betaproteobacteria bacterium]|nr:LysR family transcriptional regulator [Betaproteobacteria bacterium]
MPSRHLRYFLAVIDHKGITAAANVLHISQSALTKSIRQLEESLDVKLFERLPTGVVPTRFGDILARRVRLMGLEYQHAVAEIDAMKEGGSGVISVGAGPVWMVRFLPPAMAELCAQRRNLKVRLSRGVIDTLVPALLR